MAAGRYFTGGLYRACGRMEDFPMTKTPQGNAYRQPMPRAEFELVMLEMKLSKTSHPPELAPFLFVLIHNCPSAHYVLSRHCQMEFRFETRYTYKGSWQNVKKC